MKISVPYLFRECAGMAVNRHQYLQGREDVADYVAVLLGKPYLLQVFPTFHPKLTREIVLAVRRGESRHFHTLRIIADSYLLTTGMFPERIPALLSPLEYSDTARFSYDRASHTRRDFRDVLETLADCFSDAQKALSNIKVDLHLSSPKSI